MTGSERVHSDHQLPASPRSRRAVGVAARSRRDLDHGHSKSLRFICGKVGGLALLICVERRAVGCRLDKLHLAT